jgi:predicted secreted acid phosphatase
MKCRFFLSLLFGLILSSSQAFAWECNSLIEYTRPKCVESQLSYGICMNRQMDVAIKIMDSSAFKQSFNRVVANAQAYLDKIEPSPRKVIITDLDETLVDNRAYYAKHSTFDPETWMAWVASSDEGPYHQGVLEMLKNAKEKGFSLMFITGRPTEQTGETLEQVSEIAWDGVYLKPKGLSIPSSLYKAQVRQMLTRLGYEIVLNIGDQASDFDMPAEPEKGEFLLPNIMYTIP